MADDKTTVKIKTNISKIRNMIPKEHLSPCILVNKPEQYKVQVHLFRFLSQVLKQCINVLI